MIKSLENILKHKDSATYEEYKKVLSELEQKMFPDLTFKLTKKKINGVVEERLNPMGVVGKCGQKKENGNYHHIVMKIIQKKF